MEEEYSDEDDYIPEDEDEDDSEEEEDEDEEEEEEEEEEYERPRRPAPSKRQKTVPKKRQKTYIDREDTYVPDSVQEKAPPNGQQRTTANLSARRIKATWPLMSATGRKEILRLVDSEVLSILHDINGEKAKQEFQVAYSNLFSRLERKLYKVPVPPTTRKSHYEWDTLHNQNLHLEATLAPMLEQNQHLEDEIEMETRELEREKKVLQSLEINSKNQIGAMERLGKKAQNIYRVQNAGTTISDSQEDVNFKSSIRDIPVEPDDDENGEETPAEPASRSQAKMEPVLSANDPLVPVLRSLSGQLNKIVSATHPLNAILKECANLEQEHFI